MLPQGRDLYLPVHIGGDHSAVDMAELIPAAGNGPIVHPLTLTAEHSGHRSLAPQGGQPLVVSVQNQQTVFLYMGQQLALGLENVLPATQTFNMGIANIGNDAHIRLSQAGQIIDLSRLIHSHLQNADLCGGVQTENGHGHSNVVVEVALGFKDLILGRQHRRDHILGGSLAYAACHAYDRDPETPLIPGGQITQGPLGIPDLDVELAGDIAVPAARRQTARRPVLQSLVQISMAVKAFPHQGNEQRPGMDRPAVGLHAINGRIHRHILGQQGTVYRLQ